MQQVAEVRLATIRARQAAVDEAQRDIYEVLNGDGGLDPLVAGMAMRRLRYNGKESAVLANAANEGEKEVLKCGMRKKMLEKAVDKASHAQQRKEERMTLLDIGDVLGAKGGDSLR